MAVTEDRSVLTLPSRAPDRQLSYGPDALNVVDIFDSRPAPGGPLVVLIHGGFWRPAFDRLHLGPLANAIADAGFTTANIEYRRIPGSPDLTTRDALLACREVPRLLGHQRAVVIGHSAGGHLTLWCAASAADPSLAFIGLAPVASLTMGDTLKLGSEAVTAFLGVHGAERADLDPIELPTPASRVSIIHGTGDEIVPISLAESYRSRHPKTRLVRVEDQGHFALIDPRNIAWAALLAEITALADR